MRVMLNRIKSFLAGRDGAPVAPAGYRKVFFPGGSVDLPANWPIADQGNQGRWIVKSPDRKLQITLSVMQFAPGTLEEDCERFAMIVVERTQTELALAADAVVTRPDILTQDNGSLAAQYEGRQGRQRQFAGKLIMRRGVVIAAYVEAWAEDQPWLNDVSHAVLASLSPSGA